jgi:hypothetical protein
MKTLTTVRTPLGEFTSIASAARAHHVDRSVLLQRIAREPEQYQKTVRVFESETNFVVRGVRWPITWTQYRYQAEDVKDAIYTAWCGANGLDPDADGTADRFFAEMDSVVTDAPVPDELDEPVED